MEHRAYTGFLGLGKLSSFSKLEPTEEKMAQASEDIQLTTKSGIVKRVQHALVLDASDRARKRVHVQATAEAEAAAEGQPTPLQKPSQLRARREYESLFGETTDDQYLAKDYLLELLSQVEDNEFAVEDLSEVLSWDKGCQE